MLMAYCMFKPVSHPDVQCVVVYMCMWDTGQGDPILKSLAGETKVELPRSEEDLAGYL